MQEQRRDNQGWWLLLMVFMILWHKPILKVLFVMKYQTEIVKFSQAHNLNPSLVGAMIFVESRFNPEVVSHKGAIGLMQIMPSTGRWVATELGETNFSPDDLLDPIKNLKIGTWYLAYLKRLFQDNDYLALASYNAGHGNVSQWIREGIWNGDSVKIEQIPFPETKKYLIKILFYRKIYSYLYQELNSKTDAKMDTAKMGSADTDRNQEARAGAISWAPTIFGYKERVYLGKLCPFSFFDCSEVSSGRCQLRIKSKNFPKVYTLKKDISVFYRKYMLRCFSC